MGIGGATKGDIGIGGVTKDNCGIGTLSVLTMPLSKVKIPTSRPLWM